MLAANVRVGVDARQLSAGTMATLTGYNQYRTVDRVRDNFVCFITDATVQYDSWQEAWDAFWTNNLGLDREVVDAIRLAHLEVRESHRHHYSDCDGGCPADDVIHRLEAIMRKHKIEPDIGFLGPPE